MNYTKEMTDFEKLMASMEEVDNTTEVKPQACNLEDGECLTCGSQMKKKDSRLAKAGVSGYNKPKKTPSHPTKSHVVVAKVGDKVKTIRFGQQGVKGAGNSPKTEKEKARQKSFKARHAKNIAKGKMSAAYWANRVKW